MSGCRNTIPRMLRAGRRQLRITLVVALAVVSTSSLPAQTATEYEAKAAFLFNFIKFVRWPEAASVNRVDIVIGTSATSPFYGALQGLVGKQVGGRTVQLVTYTDFQLPALCDVVVVDRKTWNSLTRADRNALRDRHVLTVGQEAEFTDEGGVLTLFVEDDHLAFDINIEAARAAELVISANLLHLARSRQSGNAR